MVKKEKKQYYVDPTEFKINLQKYYDDNLMTEQLGEYIKHIAYGLSYLPNFVNYSYKDDMIGDALIKMYSALKNKKYDFSTGSNPFSYFTTIAFHAFINRIKKEKRHHDTVVAYKEKVYESIMTDPSFSVGNIYIKPKQHDSDDGDDIYDSEIY